MKIHSTVELSNKVTCEKCQTSLNLKTKDEISREWWHNCKDDLFYGMTQPRLIRFSGENTEHDTEHDVVREMFKAQEKEDI